MKCTFTDCPNDVTTAVSRPATEAERNKSRTVTERGAIEMTLIEIEVWDAHVEQAEKEYPFKKA